MNQNQILVIASCAVMCVGVYLFTSIKKPKETDAAAATAKKQGGNPNELDIEEYVAETAAIIQNDTIRKKVEKLISANDYENLVQEFAQQDKPLAVVYYLTKNAEAKNDVTYWVQTGDYCMLLLPTAPDDKARQYLNNTAIKAYKEALALDSTQTENQLRLASAYMEGGQQPMEGVSILLDMVKKDSTNVDALLMLGRFGIVSGQYDKAIARLEKILYLQPQNSEALLLLAEAHNKLGNKEKAVELLERCKKTVTSPELKSEIDKFIQNIK
ncbi:MAG: tetratricopeptide repeat protein [Chitinophagales bacterium]|nr:tetratricopeptide repeat protein [Chitinophagales bacterium]